MDILRLKKYHLVTTEEDIASFFIEKHIISNPEFLLVFSKTFNEIGTLSEKNGNLDFLNEEYEVDYVYEKKKTKAIVVKKLIKDTGFFNNFIKKSGIDVFEFRVESSGKYYRLLFVFKELANNVSFQLLFTLGLIKINKGKDMTDTYKVFSTNLGNEFRNNKLLKGVDFH